MRLPEFIIGGAPRSGTTWLYHLLDRHPGVHMAGPVWPEPKFFLVSDLYARGLAHYSATWFGAAPPESHAGEKSSNYLERAEAARRIRRDLPSVHMIFVLREPVARAWSNYRWSRMNGMETETFERALELEEAREANLSAERRFSRPHAYFSRGRYALLLEPWLGLFPRKQILCLRFEDILEEGARVARRVHDFLGLPVRPEDAHGLGPINASEVDVTGLDPAVRSQLAERYAEANDQLYRMLGPSFGVWT